jgi:hypothetical protein
MCAYCQQPVRYSNINFDRALSLFFIARNLPCPQTSSQSGIIGNLQLRLSTAETRAAQLKADLDRTCALLAGTEDALAAEKEEVARLYAQMQVGDL